MLDRERRIVHVLGSLADHIENSILTDNEELTVLDIEEKYHDHGMTDRQLDLLETILRRANQR